jgi:phage FluMu protein Com
MLMKDEKCRRCKKLNLIQVWDMIFQHDVSFFKSCAIGADGMV